MCVSSSGEVCLQSKASFAKLTNDGFCFPSARGSREWALCIYQSTRSLPSSHPRALSLSQGRNQWVRCSDLRWVRHNSGSLCALVSLNEWKVKCLKVGQLWGCPQTAMLVVCFSGFSQRSFCQKTFALLFIQCPHPHITEIHNKNKAEARLKVIFPKQDFFLWIVQTIESPSRASINHS